MRMNSRMGRVLPDVDAFDHPLQSTLRALMARLGDGELSAPEFHDSCASAFAAARLADALAAPMAAALATRADQILLRRTEGARDYTLQVIHVAPGEVHPPHMHHNVISTQVILQGALHAREYARERRLGPAQLAMRLLTDGVYRAGATIQASEFSRNAHWFAAGDAPVLMLNFNIRGFERETFDPPTTLGRRLIDPTGEALADGSIVTGEMNVDAAYARFGDATLAAFKPATPPRDGAAPLLHLPL